MKTPAHVAGFTLALLLAGLGSGCASTDTARYRQPTRDFEVVETSAQRPLTDSEMAEIRASVAAYLDREGVTDSGDYFLKVYLTPTDVDADSEWVVVRFTRYTAQRVALVSTYGYEEPLYMPYYSYDIYPYGSAGVSRIAFQYYVDPYYGRRYYGYPRHRDHRDGHNGHRDAGNHDHRDRPGNPPGGGGSQPPRPKYGNHGGGRIRVPVADSPTTSDDRDHRRPHRPEAPQVTPTPARWTVPSMNNNPRPATTAPVAGRPENRPGERNRPDGNAYNGRRNYPERNEARVNSPVSRPTGAQPPNYRSNPQPARTYPAPSSQTSRQATTYQPQPARSAPSSGGSGQRADNSKQENLR